MSRDRSSFLPITFQGSIYRYVMWGDSESAFKNTSIEHNFNFRGPFQKNLSSNQMHFAYTTARARAKSGAG